MFNFDKLFSMKKILLFFGLLFANLVSFSQINVTNIGGTPFPGFQPQGNPASPTTRFQFNGPVYPTIGLINAAYLDTASANLNPYLKYYPGAQIRVGDKLYVRNATATKWNEIGSGSGGGGGIIKDSAWLLTGNYNTVPGTNFIGTADAKDLVFKVNGTVAGLINQRVDGGVEYRGSVALGMGALKTSWQDNILCNIAIGPGALQEYLPYTGGPSAGASISIGRGSSKNQKTGYRNTITGEYAFTQGWTGDHNAYYGAFAGEVNSGSSYNSGFGSNALRGNKQGAGNTGIGFFSLLQNTTAVASVTITSGGSYASVPTVLFSAPEGASPGTVSTLATGTAILSGGTSGSVIGVTMTDRGSGYSIEKTPVTVSFSGGGGTGAAGTVVLTSGDNNVGVGFAAGGFSRIGDNNVFVGTASGLGASNEAVSTIDDNTVMIGYAATRLASVSSETKLTNAIAIGANSKVGCSNCAVIGDTSLSTRVGIGITKPRKLLDVFGGDAYIHSIDIGRGGGSLSTNTRFGVQALDSNTTGQRNTAVGYQTSLLISNGNSPIRNDNTSFGYQAMNNNYGSRVTAIGSFAVAAGGGADATAVGHNALLSARPNIGLATCGLAAFGKSALQNNTTGINNTGLGLFAGCGITTGGYNTAVGLLSMGLGSSVLGGTPQLTGSQNNGLGMLSGYQLSSGNNNNFFGYNSGQGITTGSNNVFIGHGSGSSLVTVSNAVIIGGNDGTGITSDQILLSDGDGTPRSLYNNVGKLRLYNYGVGTHTGTPTYSLQVDASGNIIEGGLAPGATGWDDMLSVGQVQTTDRSIDAGNNTLNFGGMTFSEWRSQFHSATIPDDDPTGTKFFQIRTPGFTYENIFKASRDFDNNFVRARFSQLGDDDKTILTVDQDLGNGVYSVKKANSSYYNKPTKVNADADYTVDKNDHWVLLQGWTASHDIILPDPEEFFLGSVDAEDSRELILINGTDFNGVFTGEVPMLFGEVSLSNLTKTKVRSQSGKASTHIVNSGSSLLKKRTAYHLKVFRNTTDDAYEWYVVWAQNNQYYTPGDESSAVHILASRDWANATFATIGSFVPYTGASAALDMGNNGVKAAAFVMYNSGRIDFTSDLGSTYLGSIEYTGGANQKWRNAGNSFGLIHNYTAINSVSRTASWPDLSGTVAFINGGQSFTSATWTATAISSTYGGTGINTSASTGMSYINSGTWAVDAGITRSNSGTISLTNILASGMLGGTGQIQSGSSTATVRTYRVTNGGGDGTPYTLFGSTSNTAGVTNIVINGTSANVIFTAANGTRQISRAEIGIANLTNTAGSETGDMVFLTQSGGTAASTKMVITGTGKIFMGGSTTPTAIVHVKAGTSAANTAPIKLTTGTLNTTAEAGSIEYKEGFTMTKESGLRYATGGVIADFVADVNNSGTGETDIYTYTTPASTFNNTGEKVTAKFAGTFNDITATAQLQFYFAGTNIGNTGALTVSATGGWNADVLIIRTGSSTARAIVTVNTPGASTALYTTETDITGITFSSTNIVKVTGTAGGAGGGSNDITGKLGSIWWFGAAAN